MKTNIDIDAKLKPMVDALKECLFTDNLAYIVRLAIVNLYQKNLHKNIDTSISSDSSPDVIPTVNLPGMSERVVRTQMERWNLSSDEYLSVVHQTMASFAAHGSEMKNPESIIFGACRRFANKRDSEKHAQSTEAPAAETPSTPDVESTYDLQDRLG